MEDRPYLSENLDSNFPAHVVYLLYALSFMAGITGIIGVIIASVKIGDARSEVLRSHFSWQIRTFWWALIWSIVGVILVFIFVGWIVLAGVYLWIIYRVVKGWLRLMDNREVY